MKNKKVRPAWAKDLLDGFDEFLDEKTGRFEARTAWPAPTYAHWYPSPFPDPTDPLGPSVAERLVDPKKPRG